MADYESAIAYFTAIASVASTISTVYVAIVVWIVDRWFKIDDKKDKMAYRDAGFVLGIGAATLLALSYDCIVEISDLKVGQQVDLNWLGLKPHATLLYMGLVVMVVAVYIVVKRMDEKRQGK